MVAGLISCGEKMFPLLKGGTLYENSTMILANIAISVGPLLSNGVTGAPGSWLQKPWGFTRVKSHLNEPGGPALHPLADYQQRVMILEQVCELGEVGHNEQ